MWRKRVRQNDRAHIAASTVGDQRSKRLRPCRLKWNKSAARARGDVPKWWAMALTAAPKVRRRGEPNPRFRRFGGRQRTFAVGPGARSILEDAEQRRRRIPTFSRQFTETDTAPGRGMAPAGPTFAATAVGRPSNRGHRRRRRGWARGAGALPTPPETPRSEPDASSVGWTSPASCRRPPRQQMKSTFARVFDGSHERLYSYAVGLNIRRRPGRHSGEMHEPDRRTGMDRPREVVRWRPELP